MRHEHKSREVIWGGQIMGARYAEAARDAAKKALREANRAEAEAWSLQMEGYGGPAQPSPTIGQCINGNGWLEVECSLQEPREHTARCDLTSTWYADVETAGSSEMVLPQGPPRSAVHMIKLTERQKITPYSWVHPDEER
jgi:hypothetical protein